MQEIERSQKDTLVQDNIINLDDLSEEITRIEVRKEELLNNPDQSAYRLLKTGDFQGKDAGLEIIAQIVVEGFTPGARYNILKIDRHGLEVFSVTTQRVNFLSRSKLSDETLTQILQQDEGRNSPSIKLTFINKKLYTFVDSSGPRRLIYVFELSPRQER